MRRVSGLFAAGLALVAAAACGGDPAGDNGTENPPPPPPAATTTDPGGTASVEEVCAEAEDLFSDLDTDGTEVRQALLDAAQSGDEAQLEQARSDYLGFVGELAAGLRTIAATAEDPQQRSAIEQFADEFENLGEQAAADPEQSANLDASGLEAAGDEVEEYCE